MRPVCNKRQGKTRHSREIDHGKRLAHANPEAIWGWDTPAGKRRVLRRAELIVAAVKLTTNMRVLEIGCGTGNFTELFAKTGARLLAVDISPDLLAVARNRGLPQDRVQVVDKAFEDCDVDGPFDAVIGSSILHHLEVDQSLRKIFQLLKPGGAMAFAEPNMLNPQILLQKNIPWLKKRLGDSPDETAFFRWSLKRQMTLAGFDHVKIRPFDWLHPFTPEPFISAVQAVGKILEKIPVMSELAGSLLICAQRPGKGSDR